MPPREQRIAGRLALFIHKMLSTSYPIHKNNAKQWSLEQLDTYEDEYCRICWDMVPYWRGFRFYPSYILMKSSKSPFFAIRSPGGELHPFFYSFWFIYHEIKRI